MQLRASAISSNWKVFPLWYRIIFTGKSYFEVAKGNALIHFSEYGIWRVNLFDSRLEQTHSLGAMLFERTALCDLYICIKQTLLSFTCALVMCVCAYECSKESEKEIAVALM